MKMGKLVGNEGGSKVPGPFTLYLAMALGSKRSLVGSTLTSVSSAAGRDLYIPLLDEWKNKGSKREDEGRIQSEHTNKQLQ
jgi:hypothetical protein